MLVFIGLCLAVLALLYFIKTGLLRLAFPIKQHELGMSATIAAFLMFYINYQAVPPVAMALGASARVSGVIAIVTAPLLLLGLSATLTQELRSTIFGTHRGFMKTARLFGKGVLLSLGCYPLVMGIAFIVHILVEQVHHFPEGQQQAISFLREMEDNPTLFWTYAILIVTLVPIAEELLFRGFLLNTLVEFCGLRWGIIFTSIVFAAFHYSATQGATNIELLCGLFFIAYVIGALYSKEQSLFAAIGMHMAFNSLGVALLYTS